MATLNQPKAAPASKYDAVVEAQLARARGRLRALDLTVGFLGLVGGTLAYALGMVLLDRWLQLPPLARQAALLVYLVAALVYVALGIVRPLCRRINPYYAARHIEQSMPEAKNSVVNWLDLHARPLPPAIHSALSQRAARDLARVDLERAISGRRAGWLGLFTGLLVVALFIALLVFGPAPFYSLLGRSFAPFVEAPIATRTVLTLKQPEGGNTTVGVGRPVRFAVEAEGRVPDAGAPDALRLLYHYQPGDPYEEQPLEREDGATWGTTLPMYKVQNGFWYKVRGGDAETPEYQVLVRATPLVNDFQAAYHYRPYLGWRDDVTREPNLRALRGTEVTLTAHTNRTVRVPDGKLELEFGAERQTLPAQAVADDPQALRFKLVLDKTGKYRVRFLSTDGEENSDTRTYTIQALPDHEPRVELQKPGKDVTLPANGLLPLEGVATDDIGLKSMTLRLRLEKGEKLQEKPYRADKSFQLADKSYPRALDYRDFVDLGSLKDEAGRAVKLEPKAVVEYWLEATDNCDYPAPNVGKSKTYKVTIAEPDPDQKKQEQDRQKARKEKKEHDANQDKQLTKEGQEGHGDRNPEHAQQDGEKNQEQKPDQPGKQENKPGADQKQLDQKDQGEKQKQPNEQSRGQDDNKQEKQDQGQDNKQEKQGQGQDSKQQGQDNKQQGKADQGQQGKKSGNAGQGQDQKAGQENRPDQQSGSKGQGADDQRRKEAEKLAQALKDQNQAGQKPNDSQKNEAGKEPKGDGQAQPKSQPGQETGNKNGSRENSKPGGEQKPGTSQEKSGDNPGKQPNANVPKPDNPKELNREPGTPQGTRPKQEGDPEALSRNNNPQAGPKNGNEQKPGGGNPSEKKNGEQPETKEGTGSGKVPPQEAKKEDVERLAKKARGGKPEERRQASQKLEEMSREAKDPEAREAARKALEEQARNQQNQPKPEGDKGSSKEPQAEAGQPKESQPKPGEKKGEPQASQPKEGQPKESQPKNAEGNQAGEKGNSKSGEKNAQAGDRKPGGEKAPGAGEKGPAQGAGDQSAGGQPGGQPSKGGSGTPGGAGSQAGQGGTPGSGEKPAGTDPAGTAKGQGGEPGEQPGGGAGNGRINTQRGSSTDEPPPPPEGKAGPKSHRPGDLVLEDLRKTIEDLKKHPEEMKKVLNRAGMTEKNLHDVEDYLNEKLPPPQQSGKLSNLGARRVATGTAKSPDAQAGSTALPPPGFRDSTREFSRRLAEPDK